MTGALTRGARAALRIGATLCAIGAMSCAHGGGANGTSGAKQSRSKTLPPTPDSVTVALWHMDEIVGARVADAGPFRLAATAGVACTPGYGRFEGAREFTRTMDSFVFAPANPVLDPASGITIELWLYLRARGQYELTPLAARWTQEGNQQSWMFAVAGQYLQAPIAKLPSPGYLNALVHAGEGGHLLFAFQPADASMPRAYASVQAIEPQRWTHVAVTFDGSVVRFYLDGRLDSQYASPGRIAGSIAPLLIGNYIDPRRLTAIGGDMHVDPIGDNNPYYALEGSIDELRISSVARTEFPTVAPR